MCFGFKFFIELKLFDLEYRFGNKIIARYFYFYTIGNCQIKIVFTQNTKGNKELYMEML